MNDLSWIGAWARGLERAAVEAAQRAPDDGTLSVSLDRHGSGEDRLYFKMCLTCHNDRESALCTCERTDT